MKKKRDKKVVISQPRYLPAINYLQRLYFADLFIFLDDVQRQSRDYENRNIIYLHGKKKWLTVPVKSSSRELICKSVTDGTAWIDGHKAAIHQVYHKHPFYNKEFVLGYYRNAEKVIKETGNNISELFIHLTLNLCDIFGFIPSVLKSSSLETSTVKGPEKLKLICEKIGTGTYISGPNGRDYGVIDAFTGSGIRVLYHDFVYPEYPQYGFTEFIPWLPFFDPLFNLGLEEVKKMISREPVLHYE